VRLCTGVSFSVSIVPFICRFVFGCEPAHRSDDRRSFDTHVQEKENVLLVKSKITPRRSGNALPRTLCALLLLSALVKHAFAQEVSPQHDHAVTPLADLLQEAEKNNPQIEAARQGWQAAKQVPTQVSTLPDPQFTLQHLSVGSPRPFAGTPTATSPTSGSVSPRTFRIQASCA